LSDAPSFVGGRIHLAVASILYEVSPGRNALWPTIETRTHASYMSCGLHKRRINLRTYQPMPDFPPSLCQPISGEWTCQRTLSSNLGTHRGIGFEPDTSPDGT
ncbi:unnamed protein product, partial [Hapterophycus canaliculatus]